MGSLMRVKMRWNGFVGSPGYSIFHLRDGDGSGLFTNVNAHDAVARINTFAGTIKSLIPNGSSLQTMADVELIEDTTGELISVLTADNAATTNSTGPSFVTYSGPSGSIVTWRTAGIRNGRRIRGRTFIVPMHGNTYDTNGTISADTITTLTTAATAMASTATDAHLGVYARPTGPGATDGMWSPVTSFSIPDLAVVLRSRRD